MAATQEPTEMASIPLSMFDITPPPMASSLRNAVFNRKIPSNAIIVDQINNFNIPPNLFLLTLGLTY